jgi:hypothetical protein|tara:strand:+ start:793 stop:996 length:204 start_codon:yes stop_codon:yes gene_type:complete
MTVEKERHFGRATMNVADENGSTAVGDILREYGSLLRISICIGSVGAITIKLCKYRRLQGVVLFESS